jgi:hypothetical protein
MPKQLALSGRIVCGEGLVVNRKGGRPKGIGCQDRSAFQVLCNLVCNLNRVELHRTEVVQTTAMDGTPAWQHGSFWQTVDMPDSVRRARLVLTVVDYEPLDQPGSVLVGQATVPLDEILVIDHGTIPSSSSPTKSHFPTKKIRVPVGVRVFNLSFLFCF